TAIASARAIFSGRVAGEPAMDSRSWSARAVETRSVGVWAAGPGAAAARARRGSGPVGPPAPMEVELVIIGLVGGLHGQPWIMEEGTPLGYRAELSAQFGYFLAENASSSWVAGAGS